jgi:hypothetical protein
MAKKKKKNPKSCPRGKKLVKIEGRKARSFCASTSKKKSRGGKKSGIAKMSKKERKAITAKACRNSKNSAKFRNSALCDWAKAA